MELTIGRIASIRTGIFAKSDRAGECVYLQAKHFDDNGVLSSSLYPDLEINKQRAKHLLKSGDILFAAKGTKNFAALFGANNPPSVASTTFFVLTVRDAVVLPEYLVWILNNDSTQSFLKRRAIGSSIVSISKEVLSDLEIDVPPKAKQKLILEVSGMARKENELRSKIAELRQKLIQQEINNALK